MNDPGLKLHMATWPPSIQPEQHEGQAMIHNNPQIYSRDDPAPRLRVLLSYWYYKDVDLDRLMQDHFAEPYPEVFIDSGAFSGMTQGVSIEIDEYAEFIERWKHWISIYANLDVIRYPDLTWYHQQRLEDRGLHPLPVYHVATSWDWLEHYLDRYPYIALGVAGSRSTQYMGWAVRCFQMAGDQSVFHGFGITSWKVLKSLPWYSVDSTSWGQGFMYGQVPIFDPRRGKWHKLKLGDRQQWYRHAHLIRSMGFDPEDFADRERNSRTLICAISALSYMNAERWLRTWHGEIRIPDRDDQNPGNKIYQVVGPGKGSNMSMESLAEGVAEARSRSPETKPDPTNPDDPGLHLYFADTSGLGPGSNIKAGHNHIYGPPSQGSHVYLADTTGRDLPEVQQWIYNEREDS